jgi:hypothetical protein
MLLIDEAEEKTGVCKIQNTVNDREGMELKYGIQ